MEIKFDVNCINITDIMQQIHANTALRGYDLEELKRLDQPITFSGKSEALTDCNSFEVTATANVKYWWEIPAGVGIKGKFRVLINKVTRKFTFFYMKHVVDQQNIFNKNTADCISKLSENCNKLLMENTKLIEQNNNLQNEIRNLNTIFSGFKKNILSEKELSENYKFDYFKFSEKFRGSFDEIKGRLIQYVEYYKGQENVLDFGCGRGEFLTIMLENTISCIGVDLNIEDVSYCQKQNLPALLDNGLTYLENCKDNSLGGIFASQVIEHISTEELVKLARLGYKKLKPGAYMILETLNPQTLMIFTESLYMDPSHFKPVHPLTVKFIAECEGFVDIELKFITPSDASYRLPLDIIDDENKKPIETLNNLIYGNREYALIARK